MVQGGSLAQHGVAGVGVRAPAGHGTSGRPSTAGSGSSQVDKRQLSQSTLLTFAQPPHPSRQELQVPMVSMGPSRERTQQKKEQWGYAHSSYFVATDTLVVVEVRGCRSYAASASISMGKC